MSDAHVPPRLVFDGICKDFFGVQVLQDVSFELPVGSVTGLIGENGAGKSTLMNILGGVLSASTGSMRLDGESYEPSGPVQASREGVVFVHQELNLFPNLSIAENLFLTAFPRAVPGLIGRRSAYRQARELLARIGLERDPGTSVELLSVGERQQLEIAKALHGSPKVIILDEPTTSLTARETVRLFDVINDVRATGTSVLYISHILADVQELCDRVVVLRDGRLVDQGPTSGFTTDLMISRMVGRDLDRLYPEKRAVPTDRPVLELREVSEPGLVHEVSLTVHRQEVVGLFGLMGAGRSETARMVFGLDTHRRGTVSIDGNKGASSSPRAAIRAGMAFVTEDRRHEGLLMDSSVVDNIALATLERTSGPLGWVRTRLARQRAVEKAAELNLKSSRPQSQPVKALSGGNQQKAVLAKWLLTDPEVLILDEPTRGIDVGAKHEIYRVIDDLAAGGAGILMISSELGELTGTCDRVLVMRRGEIVAEFAGPDYADESILGAAFGQHGTGPAQADDTRAEPARHGNGR